MRSCISINLRKDNIVIKVNEEYSQEDIVYTLRKKIPDLKKLYQGEHTPIVITGKVLKNKEIDEIQELIKKYLDVQIKFDSPRTLGLHGIVKTYNKEIAISETKFHRGAVRSGQKLEFEGSIVIMGDVNDGAEVIAGDNIVILGALRGLAHAGAKGNVNAIIAASSIDAPQLRIANIIKEREKEEIQEDKKTYACLDEKGNLVMQ
ncbi:MAG: septum site-determining protein MinC [Clostridium sp.]|jgi:septum site-determining protein MinC|nr:septum site-determining protein MinC [Clostridium sp.]